MRRSWTCILAFLLLPTAASAQSLETAYQREVGYLKSQERALKTRLADVEQQGARNVTRAKSETRALQNRWLSLQAESELLQEQLAELNANAPSSEDQSDALLGTYEQARQSLLTLGYDVTEHDNPSADQFEALFGVGNSAVVDGRKTVRREGKFFTSDGVAKTGEIRMIGRVAAYAGATPLAPAGEGRFREWPSATTPGVVLFESVEKALDPPKQKTLADTIRGGGTIGIVILVLGAVALLLMLLRIVMLLRYSTPKAFVTELEKRVNHRAEAAKFAETKSGLPARAAAKLLGRVETTIDDVDEVISGLAPRVERFSTMLMVIAAVAPLLGLLGTVTGMIATFDIITEFGTGDPKLLSSGISEALITTKLGLVVAIPSLIVGNILRAWGEGIVADMEYTALLSRGSSAEIAEVIHHPAVQITPLQRGTN